MYTDSSAIPTPPTSRSSTLLSGKACRYQAEPVSPPNSVVVNNEAEQFTVRFSDCGGVVPMTSMSEQNKDNAITPLCHDISPKTRRVIMTSKSVDSPSDRSFPRNSGLRQRPRSAERCPVTERLVRLDINSICCNYPFE
jgi:hypothetical protein